MAPFRCALPCIALLLILVRALLAAPVHQQTLPPTEVKPPETPAQIEFLETHIHFEANGDSRKEVHTRVRINNELGVRQFSRLTFDFNRAFQQVEIPSVHITHASGGTADILPGAISDQPNPAVASAPAYEDVRVKSIRILGLSPGDILEYRVVTTTTHGPFAPNFYLSHDFANETVVAQELFEVDVPASKAVKPITSKDAQNYESLTSGSSPDARVVYRWRRSSSSKASDSEQTAQPSAPQFDIALTSMTWTDAWVPLENSFLMITAPAPEVKAKAEELSRGAATPEDKLRVLYDFVARKISTVDLPLGTTGFRLRKPAEILSSGYAVPEEKCLLLSSLAWEIGIPTSPALVLPSSRLLSGPAIPSTITDILVVSNFAKGPLWLDPAVEVAPFAMVPSSIRGKIGLLLLRQKDVQHERISNALPFAAMQRVSVDALLSADGTLNAKVHYTLRGDNELLLRVAFHQSPREKWKDVAQLLALSDGFRGKITTASASDPYATKQPFTIDYEITQPKFVDWSKKPVRIPALLPALGLPDAPAKADSGAAPSPIELGTPLNVDTKLTLHLPAGASALSPTGTSVERDYATFVSHYAAEGNVVFASRHINFILREVPATRTVDYNAFLHAVQTDQSQLFTLNPAAPAAPAPSDQVAATPRPKP
jgi:hypothetical protein